MPVPAEITNLFTPQNVHDLEQGLENFVLRRIAGGIGGAVWRSIRKVLGPHLPPDDLETVRTRVTRLEEVLDGIEQQRSDQQSYNDAVEASNAHDPGFEDFVSRAVESAMCSASEGKRLLLGRLAGKRAAILTESMADLRVRSALRMIDETTVEQLYVIVSLYFVAHTPLPTPGTANAQQICIDLDRKYFEIFDRVSSTQWSDDDLHYLVAVGALRHVDTEGNVPKGRLERTLSPGGRYWPIPMGAPPSSPFLRRTSELDAPNARAGHGRPLLRGYALTPAGVELALAIIESLSIRSE